MNCPVFKIDYRYFHQTRLFPEQLDRFAWNWKKSTLFTFLPIERLQLFSLFLNDFLFFLNIEVRECWLISTKFVIKKMLFFLRPKWMRKRNILPPVPVSGNLYKFDIYLTQIQYTDERTQSMCTRNRYFSLDGDHLWTDFELIAPSSARCTSLCCESHRPLINHHSTHRYDRNNIC